MVLAFFCLFISKWDRSGSTAVFAVKKTPVIIMIRPVTQNVFDSLMMDIWPRPAGICDFGINSEEHYAALQGAVKQGATIEELEEALGNGAKITALVQKYGSDIQFQTSYDALGWNSLLPEND